MPYATRADIEDTYPGTLARIAYNRDSGAVDDGVIDAALEHATALIDIRMSQRYALPLSPVPLIVRGYCIDIAVYRICLTRDKLTVEMRQRYEDAIADLKEIAAGKSGIGNPAIDPATGVPSKAGQQDKNFGRASIRLMRRQG